jgi:hypothetical protein
MVLYDRGMQALPRIKLRAAGAEVSKQTPVDFRQPRVRDDRI